MFKKIWYEIPHDFRVAMLVTLQFGSHKYSIFNNHLKFKKHIKNCKNVKFSRDGTRIVVHEVTWAAKKKITGDMAVSPALCTGT